MSGKHGRILRGLDHATAPGEIARFGHMFPNLRPAVYSDASLEALANAMVSPFDPPKDGPDSEESGIPSLYTYFGQFVDHDITFGPEGSFEKQKDIDATVDFRTPAFDLDNVYGRGQHDQPYMYAEDGKSLLLGGPITQGNPNARDLQRNGAGRALIGDPRNDENAIVSQLQGVFLQFHNRVVADNPDFAFEDAQAYVRAHYQHVVLHDFLPRIVHASVLEDLKTDGDYDPDKIRYFSGFQKPYMPVEFSVAAYRMGHSMIRPGYRLNDSVLLPIFPLPAAVVPGFPEGLTGFRALISDWALDWGRFIDLDVRDYGTAIDPTSGQPIPDDVRLANFQRLQYAYRIDTALVDPLGSLPLAVAGNPPPSLAFRNLQRSVQMNLPSGQDVARAMDARVLADKEILIGQGVDHPDAPLRDIISMAGAEFTGSCPLWTYILAEAMHYHIRVEIPVAGGRMITTPQLGPVGGRIVAEVFLGLYFAQQQKVPTPPGIAPPDGFALKDFVKYALDIV